MANNENSNGNGLEVIQVNQAEIVGALNKAEVDIQIATAKAYPRNISDSLNKIATYATMDPDTAADCFYVLRRKNARGEDNVIEGLSVRMAEIIAGAWGNLRVQTMIIGNDGKTITARAMCHDLETNFAVAQDVKRRITDRSGRTYSEDMQVVTGNAAAAIAFRNAVLRVVPKAVTKRIIEEVKKVAMGQSLDLEQSRQNVLTYFQKVGVTQEQIFAYLGVKSLVEIDKSMIFELRATANAIKEGTTTAYETFIKPVEDAKREAEAKAQADTAKGKAEAAMAAAAAPAEDKANRTSPDAPKPVGTAKKPAPAKKAAPAPAPQKAEEPKSAPAPAPAPQTADAPKYDVDPVTGEVLGIFA
ncbi:MAG: hypothetical protein LUC24_03400 [Bacteroidales bacterium]|nr:hypothetical protein [Bacteroidales bacterium]